MYYIIKKGRSNTTYIFIATGIFLIISFSIQLYIFSQTTQFKFQFPGDWDKPLGIIIGVFLIIRSRRFRNQRLGLFIKIDDKKMTFRTQENQDVQKVTLTDIINVSGNEDGITLKTSTNQNIVIDLTAVKSEKEMKILRKNLIQKLNS
ncbi:MAG: hypothetical protein MK202_00355 [Tenacibaculum sp.]|nr:hypothetical protein [Tenacibaculum sp.]